MLDCLAEVAKECDELEAAQQELVAACAHHGAQGSSLQELMKQAQETLKLVQQQQEQGGGHVHSDEREQRLELAQGDLKKSVENMLYQIQLLVRASDGTGICVMHVSVLRPLYSDSITKKLRAYVLYADADHCVGTCRLNPQSTWQSGFMDSPYLSHSCLGRTGATKFATS